MEAIEIELGNVGSKKQAEAIANKLNGKTYYDFVVSWSPDAGNYPVVVSTNYPGAKKKAVVEMLLFLMACEL